ncbi:MAG: 2TM domain-containing protein [bacterium]
MNSPDTLHEEEIYASLKALALAFIREHGGLRATESELVARLDSSLPASEGDIARAAGRLRQQNFLRPDDHVPAGAEAAASGAAGVAAAAGANAGALSGASTGSNPATASATPAAFRQTYVRDLLVPDILPDSDDALDDDSKEYKRYEEQWDLILREEHAGDLPEWIVEAYRSQAQELAQRSSLSTLKHIGIYLAVNTGLTAIWITSGVSFPWVVFPAFGWLMGLSSDIASTICRRRHADVLTGSKRPSARHLPLLRSRQKAERKHLKDAIVNPFIILGLTVFNVVSSSFPWAVFPGVILGIAALGSVVSLRKQQRDTATRLAQAGYEIEAKKPWWRRIFGSSPTPDTVSIAAPQDNTTRSKARVLASEIRAQLQRIGGSSDTHGEISETVDECARVVEELEQKHRELSELLTELDRDDLDRERAELTRQLASTSDHVLAGEYSNAIAGIDRQLSGIQVLQREREVVSLRLQSALGSLKQLRVDLARIQHAGSAEELSAAREIDERTREMSAYLRDLGAAYQDMNTKEL